MVIAIEELNGTPCKTYLLSSGGDAALVDPVRERFDTYKLALGQRGLTLRMVLETHLHADHLMLNRAAKESLGAEFVMHEKSPSPLRKQQAASWRVYKSPEPAAAGATLYVYIVDPAVKGADYAVTTILSEAFDTDELSALLKRYTDAYASGQNFVNLSLVLDLGK